MKEQIEEMARTLCGEKENTCEECDSHDMCEFWAEASVLHNNGYRKQSEVAREIFAEIETVLSIAVYPHVNANGTITTKRAESLRIRADDYNTIKKKYIEEA